MTDEQQADEIYPVEELQQELDDLKKDVLESDGAILLLDNNGKLIGVRHPYLNIHFPNFGYQKSYHHGRIKTEIDWKPDHKFFGKYPAH